jgi:hypothetical protein
MISSDAVPQTSERRALVLRAADYDHRAFWKTETSSKLSDRATARCEMGHKARFGRYFLLGQSNAARVQMLFQIAPVHRIACVRSHPQ